MNTKNSAKMTLAALVALASLGGLAACNTVKGAGEDIKATGTAVSDAAQETKEDIQK
jgi:predicted small secreted protein